MHEPHRSGPSFLRRFARHRLAAASAGVLLLMIGAAIAAPWLAPTEASTQDLSATFASPSRDFPLGTDSLGRDQLSRLLYGGRVSLAVGFGVAAVAGVIGVVIGSVAGYAGGWVDSALMRVTDFFLALPGLIVLIVAARVFGDGIVNVVLIVAAITWMPLARIVRGVRASTS